MPKLRALGEIDASQVRAVAVRCDGVDERPREEGVESDRVWFVLRGRFEVRSARARCAGDPATALLLRSDDPFTIRHPDECGDLCLSVSGPLVREGMEGRGATAPLSVGSFVRLRDLARRLAAGQAVDPLELEEALCRALEGPGTERDLRASPRERRLARAVAHELALRFDEPLSLASLAAPHGVSVFALCRAFRKVRGTTIHRTQQRLRVRHALATMLDTDWSLAEIAAECGFASHAHLTGVFQREIGVPPSVARRTPQLFGGAAPKPRASELTIGPA